MLISFHEPRLSSYSVSSSRRKSFSVRYRTHVRVLVRAFARVDVPPMNPSSQACCCCWFPQQCRGFVCFSHSVGMSVVCIPHVPHCLSIARGIRGDSATAFGTEDQQLSTASAGICAAGLNTNEVSCILVSMSNSCMCPIPTRPLRGLRGGSLTAQHDTGSMVCVCPDVCPSASILGLTDNCWIGPTPETYRATDATDVGPACQANTW